MTLQLERALLSNLEPERAYIAFNLSLMTFELAPHPYTVVPMAVSAARVAFTTGGVRVAIKGGGAAMAHRDARDARALTAARLQSVAREWGPYLLLSLLITVSAVAARALPSTSFLKAPCLCSNNP